LCYHSKWWLRAPVIDNYDVYYNWEPDTFFSQPGTNFIESVLFTMQQSTTIKLIMTTEFCMDVDSIYLKLRDTIGMHIETDAYRVNNEIYTLAGEPLNLYSPGGYLSYYWEADDEFNENNIQNPVLTPLYDQTVIARGVTPSYCYERDTAFVIMRQVLSMVYDVFTPNDDGYNDFWIIPNSEQYPDLEVFIFNRWGQQVFYSKPYGTDLHHTWDGKSQKNGKDLPIGSYYYIIKPNDGEQQPLTGTVTIVR
jgi:gliding motility-associated-like protein